MATKNPEGSFEWYRQVFSSILNDDMHQYQNLNDTYQLLLNFSEDFSLEDAKNREFAMKISKYAHAMAQLEAAHTGNDNLFDLYWDMLLFEARNYQVDSGLLYLEKNRPQKEKFYEPRREVFEKFNIVQSFQDLMDDKLDFLSVSMPPGTGKSTTEIFFLALVGGWYPNDFNLSSAHSSILTRSLYDGIAEIINDPDYSWHEIFPKLKLQSTNAKETTINLERAGRFKTWTFRSIDGSLTGATRCNRFLTADDLVSGIEEALNKNRLETLWTKVVNDLLSRQLDGCKRIFFATRWSVHDPIGRMWDMYEGTSKARFIVAPALDENGESNFQYKINGFSTEYFKEQMELMDEISANALYMQKPVEREGILLPASELRRFFLTKEQVPLDRSVFDVFPERQPDAIWAVCDTKDKGTDFESLPIAYQYGEDFYIPDVLYDDSTDYEYLDQKTADILIKHNPHVIRFESNSAGGRVSYNVGKLIEGKCSTVIEEKYTTQNKETKILVNSGWIKQHCIFLEPSLYAPKSDYGKFMGNVTSYTTKAKAVHDDGIDTLAILSETVREKYGTNRRKTRIMKSPI